MESLSQLMNCPDNLTRKHLPVLVHLLIRLTQLERLLAGKLIVLVVSIGWKCVGIRRRKESPFLQPMDGSLEKLSR